MTRHHRAVLIVSLVLSFSACLSVPASLAVAEIAMVANAVEPAVSLVTDVASLSVKTVTGLVRLPLGVAKVVLCPLPGISLAGGVKDIAAGVATPFHLVGGLLKLPVKILNVATAAGSSVIP
jgi:hypothetical protein